ncbi:lysis system o-spanin lipoprotein Rz1, partial [Serratia bockelmannii]
MVLASCASPPHANPPSPPAWMMMPAPDLLTPLNGIISP